MMAYYDEENEHTPLLPRDDYREDDVHHQFCQLVGVPPSDLPRGRHWVIADRSLYARAMKQKRNQSVTYNLAATVTNFLLLAQLVLGAALTGLGATAYSPIMVTVLGATNTIIAGLVAYLKSRGQPNRSRMFRDDLERVVDEIENSEVMWMGISKGVNGYDDIDTEGEVTVRSEVARLTRLYDKAVRTNTMNNPDAYGQGDNAGMVQLALKNKNLPSATQGPVGPSGPANEAPAAGGSGGESSGAGGSGAAAPAGPSPVAADPDESPATAKPTPPKAVKSAIGDEAEKAEKAKAAGAKGKKKEDDDEDDDAKEAEDGDKKVSDDQSSDKADEKKTDGDSDAKKKDDAPAPTPAAAPAAAEDDDEETPDRKLKKK